MTFSAFASGVTTQTGTDTNLSGMSNLTGTNYVYSAQGTQRTVLMNNTGARILVNGTLTIPIATDQLLFGTASNANQISIVSGGRLILDGRDSGVPKQGYGIKAGRTASDWFNPSQSIVSVASGAALEMQGSGIYVSQPVNIYGTVISRNARVRLGVGGSNTSMFRFQGSPIVDIDGLDLVDASFVLDIASATLTNLKGISVNMTLAGTNNCAILSGIVATWIDPTFVGNVNTHFSCIPSSGTARRQKIYGWQPGLAPLIGKVPDFSTAVIWVEGRKIINLTVRNTALVAQENVRALFTDVNNGNRQNGTAVGAPNFTSSITYEVTSTAEGIASLDVLLWEVVGQLSGSPNVNINKSVDFRWPSNNVDAVITIPLKSYSNLPGSVDVSAGGFGQAVAATAFVTTDSAVTLSSAEADALTFVANTQNFYDAAKAWSWQSVNFNYPSATSQPINASGTNLNMGSISLTVDNSASAAFAVNTSSNVITVKSPSIASSEKFNSITTTGTITLTTQAGSVGTYASLSASTVALAGGTNYQSLTATTAITGLPTTGNVSTAGSLGFGSSTITATGNLSIANTALSGTLTISTATARTITLTSITGSITVNVTGGGSLNVVLAGTTAAGSVITGAGVTKSVQCSVAVNGGNTFNLVKRYGATGSYTDLGYTAGITSDSFLVPLGQPVEVAIWTLGFITFTRTIQTTDGGFSLLAEMIPEPDVDVSLDVSFYLNNIAVTYGSGAFTATFNADMDVPGIEPSKAILHRLLGLEGTMRALLPPGMSTTLDVETDEIQINKPAVFFVLGAGATNVNIAGFFNTVPAKLINPAYIINPRRVSDNLRVEIPLVKPALDVAAMAAAVWSAATRTLTSGGGVTLAEIEASTVLAKEATVTALATTNQAEHDATQTAIAALPAPVTPPTAAANAAATRTELATELARLDVAVSSRSTLSAGAAMTLTGAYDAAKTAASATALGNLATANQAEHDATQAAIAELPEPVAPPTSAANATAVRTELATELARMDAAVSSRSTLTAQDIPEGLTAAEVWSATTRTLTETPGLTTGQAEQLRKVAQLHGVGATLVVTETNRTAGDVNQAVTTVDSTTTVQEV